MSGSLDTLADWVRTRPVLHRSARLAVRLIPDVAWTRRFPEIGPIRFRLRQQRWYLWESFAKNDHFMLGVFDRLARPGDVVYDIGANIGIYARIVAQWFDAKEIIAFEPMRRNVELLRENVRLGGLEDRIRILAIAVGDADGEEDLQIDDVRSTTAALDRVTGGAPSAGRKHFGLPPMTERVRVARLDTVVAEESLPPPGLIKIDTEGAEAMVIDGARETITAHKPRLTVATHGPDRADATLEGLHALGYHCYGFVEDANGCVYARLEPGDGARLANNNLVASANADDVSAPLEEKSPASVSVRGA